MNTGGKAQETVKKYLPELFQPHLLCAGYQPSSRGSCEGDSGGPLMVYNATKGQYIQIGMVSGGVSNCGNTDIPDYYARLDHPKIAGFINELEHYNNSDSKTPGNNCRCGRTRFAFYVTICCSSRQTKYKITIS
jgi:secreted trypsin-like serine protease